MSEEKAVMCNFEAPESLRKRARLMAAQTGLPLRELYISALENLLQSFEASMVVAAPVDIPRAQVIDTTGTVPIPSGPSAPLYTVDGSWQDGQNLPPVP